MCSITGIAGPVPRHLRHALKKMGRAIAHRGPDQSGLTAGEGFAFQHNRLSVIDPENGRQPMRAACGGHAYTIVYNGELYNTGEMRGELEAEGVRFHTHCDTEVVLQAYIRWGKDCVRRFNGIFAFAVRDGKRGIVFFGRDRLGVKPLFYTLLHGMMLFASEIKALLRFPGMRARVDAEGLWQLAFLLPVREAGRTVFRGIFELPPACRAEYGENGLKIEPYWSLEAYPLEDGEERIVEKTAWLVKDAVVRQLVSDVPLCTFLSGGLDSSAVTALACEEYNKRNERLSTYSFEFEGNREHFTQSLFQPQRDDEFAVYLAERLGTRHDVLIASTRDVVRLLKDAAVYRDFPGMADVDASLLYYCRRVAETHKVAVSGECADEVFGGYPWFYRQEMLSRDFFPWIHRPFVRASLFSPELLRPDEGWAYAQDAYRRCVASCPVSPGDSPKMRSSRIASWLSIQYFMASLLERKDRMSMASGLEVRVPFADHRLVEYVYNVPWEIKYRESTEKWLLRAAMRGKLPDAVLYRKKSPYPKTHDPAFEEAVRKLLDTAMRESPAFKRLLKKDALQTVCGLPDETWFGQLMGRPQLMAWLLQLDAWFTAFRVELV